MVAIIIWKILVFYLILIKNKRCLDLYGTLIETYLCKYRYKEVCESLYSFNDSKSSSITGHFTQLIWKSSKKFGFGFATKKNGNMTCHYSVARYRPAGNMAGEYVSNVLKGKLTKLLGSK